MLLLIRHAPLLLIGLAAIAVACGGDASLGGVSPPPAALAPTSTVAPGGEVLRLPTCDVAAAELERIERAYVATFYSKTVCGAYLGASDEEALQARVRDYKAGDPGEYVRPLADVSEADLLQAALIRRAECERFSP